MWEHPCVDRVSDIFGEKAGFAMNASHIFPQDVLAAVTLIRVYLVLEDLKPVQGVRRDFLSALWLLLPYQEQDPLPSCWSRSPGGWA